MSNYMLSVCIPARNEWLLSRTVEDILEHKRGKTEVIVGLDGWEADPPLPEHPDLRVVYEEKSIGQRAITNRCVEMSEAKYVMKLDAHCAIEEGMDVKMLQAYQQIGDEVIMAPLMKHLHAWDWICPKCGGRRYQGLSYPYCVLDKRFDGDTQDGRTRNPDCDSDHMVKKIVWKAKRSPNNISFCFDSQPHFQYAGDQCKKPGFLEGIIVGYNLQIPASFFSSDSLTQVVSPSLLGTKPSLHSSIIGLLTDLAGSHQLTGFSNRSGGRKNVSMDAVGLSSIDDSGGIGVQEVECIGNKSKMGGVTTSSVSTDMVNDGNVFPPSSGDRANEPGVKETMCQFTIPEVGQVSISSSIKAPLPIPTTGDTINSEVIDKLINIFGGRFIYNEKTGSFHNGSVALTLIYKQGITETMSLQGSCFMATRKNYWELDLCDETLGNWGNQGIEVALASWLSGHRVMVNHRTWYAHMFRTQGKDFGFPYTLTGDSVRETKEKTWSKFLNFQHPKQIYPVSWLVKKFWPVRGWNDEELMKLEAVEKKPNRSNKSVIYFTDSQLDEKIAQPCREQISRASKGLPIVSSSLKRLNFGVKNIHFPSLERGYLALAKQILAAVENSKSEIIFFCEHDVLYHPSHFEFVPPDKETFYYNQNVWYLRLSDGHCMHYDVNQLSGLCGWREALLTHFRERYERIKEEGFTRRMGFEPFTHNRVQWKTTYKAGSWKSPFPNIDIRHGANATGARWKKEEFRNQNLLINWIESDEIPGWGKGKELIKNFL